MKYLAIQNFKYGLDSRKDELTSQPGTLQTLENAFVNQGGEVEKREAFEAFADVSVLDSNENQGTFGLQEVSTGLLVFGSAYTDGVTEPYITAPTGVTYQQLVHPEVVQGVTYDDTRHRITAVTCSAQFGDKAWVVATYTSGDSYVFYDGSPVMQFVNGEVLVGLTSNVELAAQLAGQLTDLTGWQVTLVNNYVELKSPTNISFALTQSVTTDDGTLVVSQIDDGQSASAGESATATFIVTSSTADSTFLVEGPDSLGGYVRLHSAETVAGLADVGDTASAIALAINTHTTGYTAEADGDTLVVSAPIAYGTLVGLLVVTVGGSGGAVASVAPSAFSVALSEAALSTTDTVLSSYYKEIVSPTVTVLLTAPTGVVTKVWETSDASIIINGQGTATASFSKSLRVDRSVSFQIRCKCTDTPVNVVYTNWINVVLTYGTP